MARGDNQLRPTVSGRFYSEQRITGREVRLSGDEAHHMLHVMRARAGSEVTVFDGSGCEFRCVVRETRRHEALLEVLDRREVRREPPLQLSVAVALPKGERQAWLVEKLSELGAMRLIPIHTERGTVLPGPQTTARLRRIAIQAAKQCGATRLLEIAAAQTWQSVASALPSDALGLIAHPAGSCPAAEVLKTRPFPPAVFAAVGPEGGWSDSELAVAADFGWQMVRLGPRILRVETAALTLAALIVLQAEATKKA